MLSEKTKYLLRQLHTDAKTIAGYTDLTPSGLARLCSGARQYSPQSQTVRKLADAIVCFTKETHQLELLCIIIQCTDGTDDEIRASLLAWLFQDDVPLSAQSDSAAERFSKRLRVVMELAGVSGSRLSKDLFIDTSYVSRMRNGRMPQRNSELVRRLGENVALRIFEANQQKALAERLDLPPEYVTPGDAPEQILDWLYGNGFDEDIHAVKTLIEQIAEYPSAQEPQLPDYQSIATDEILNDSASVYEGRGGLQNAVIRFLGNSIARGSRELWLYSDQSMEWMNGDFRQYWFAMMWKCLAGGTHIRIIHHVERSAAELLLAIRSWLPLYLSGMISSYYSLRKHGDRFSHTIFLDPGHACIAGCCVRGLEINADYSYLTNEKMLQKKETALQMLLLDSRPLIRMQDTTAETDERYSLYTEGSVQVLLGKTTVIVNKLAAPNISFTFSHPVLRKAFAEYVTIATQTAHPEETA